MEKINQKIRPIFDRILLREVVERETQSGIILPKGATERSLVMQVVAVGTTDAVMVGDRVIVAKYAGTEVILGVEKFHLVCEYDILGVIENAGA